MTIHTHIKSSDRSLLPRALLGRRPVRNFVVTYRFAIGQKVLFHGESAIIRERQRSAKGREIYSIELVEPSKRPFRVVLGTALTHTVS